MADKAITDLVELAATPAVDDWVEIVDISEGSPADQNKKITTANLLASALTAAGNATITGTITFNPAGSAPFATTKTGVVTNLNADTVDGSDASAFAAASHNHAGTDITSGTISNDRLNAGSGNGLDADTVDTWHAISLVKTTTNQSIAGIKTFSARPAFNGGETGVSAPFTVDSTYLVTNLNADTVDGIHGTALAEIGATETISAVWTFGAIPAFNGGTTGVSAPFTVDSTYVVSGLNADQVDGLDSTDIVQTAGAQNVAGIKTFTDGIALLDDDTVTFGTGSDSILSFNGTDLILNLVAGDFVIKDGGTERFRFNRDTGIFEAVDVQINT